MDMPTSLVEKRRWRASVYCSREYFDVVCFVDSTYLANLMLKMMMAYNDGDIISKIKFGILSHDDSRDRFSCLSGSDNEDDNCLLLAYIMERYANMRGTYFVKHLKGNSGDQLKKLVSCQATRTKLITRSLVRRQPRWNRMEMHSSTTTRQSVKFFGRWLLKVYSN